MRPAPPSDTRVRTEVLTSSVVDADVPSSAVMRMVTSVLQSPLFSATELIDSSIDLARVFRVAATSCERGRVAATSAEIREDTIEDPSSTSTLFEETTWQAVAARMESLPARPAIDCESIVPGVCMVDNRSGLFRLVSSTGQVYVPARVLLDSGAQPLMLGKAACIILGIRRSELEPCPFQIQTSLGGASDRSHFMTRESIAVQLRHDHPHDSSQFGVCDVVTSAESYDVLVGGVVLYPMGFRMDNWTETTAYRPGWQYGDGHLSELPVRFISRDRPLGSSSAVLASVAGFSGVLTWPDDLLEGNMSADDTSLYEDVKEVVSFTAAVTSSLDVPLWSSCQALQLEADRLVKKAWSEASLPAKPEKASADRLVGGSSALSPLGVCLLDLFGGISTGLAAVLQSRILVRRYLYVEKDETASRVSSRHVAQLMRRFPSLLPRSAIRGFQKALPSDISLLGAPDLDRVGHIDMVIAGWPCQGHTRARHGTGLHDPRSRMFWEMMRVLRHLQVQQTRSPAYILENVPLLGDTRAQLMTSVHQVRAWIGSAVLLDAARVGSRAHRARLWWTNLLPREILRHAYDSVQRDPTLTVDSILDVFRHSQVVRVADRSPMALVNRLGQPRMTLPTLVSYPASHAYRDGRPRLLWDSTVHQLVEPNADEIERAMEFMTGVTATASVLEASRRQVLGQAMDLNCLTWIEWKPLIGSQITRGERRRLTRFLRDYRSCFAFSMKELGVLIGPGIRIELASDTPIFHRPYRYSEMERDLIPSRTLDLLEAGLVELSHGEYASANIMPVKKDVHGNYTDRRMCGDYRTINRQTKSDKYAMPTPEEIFDVDCLYQWRFLPFGLKNAPAEFQRVMDRILAGLDFVRCYIDDILVFSDIVEQHQLHLQIVFKRLRAHGLRLHPGKCKFFHEKVEYLGHVIYPVGLGVQQAKVEAIARIPRPTDVSRVRAFMSLANYYRRYVKGFSAIAKPLDQLLKAFVELKVRLVPAPILRRPIRGRPYQLHTDWSMLGLGAVLTQRDDEGKEFVVAYASRSNSAVESRYSSYKGECLAAVWAVAHFRCYLFGTQFTLVTDHQPLKWLMDSDKLTGKLARWDLILYEYDFQVVHRPGVANLDADGLSRNSCTSQEDDTGAKWHDPEVEDGGVDQRDVHDDALVLEFLRTSMMPGTVGTKERDRVLQRAKRYRLEGSHVLR
ncbi:hypothetical protein MARPO_0091s0058, partial [Marchantia polymorpha]